MTEHVEVEPAPRPRFLCGMPGCSVVVAGIYCEPHSEERARARREAAEKAAERMKDPEYQAKLRAAREAKKQPAQEGEGGEK